MIIDAYNNVWKAGGTSDYLTASDYTVEMMISAMDVAGIDRAMATSLGQMIDNQYIADSVQRYPERIIGFGQIDPRNLAAVNEIGRMGEEAIFHGIKLHPTMHGYHFADHGLLDPIFAACRDVGFIVLVNALDDPFCAPLAIEEIAKTFPEVPVIIAHMGSVWNTNEAIMVASRSENLYLETSAAELQAVQDAYESVGPSKLLMGTDWPGSAFDLERMKVAKAVPDEADRSLVEGQNFARLMSSSARLN